MKKLVLLALLASCEGRCNHSDAAKDQLGPTAESMEDHYLRGNQVWVCQFDGPVTFTAKCGLKGTLVTTPEAP